MQLPLKHPAFRVICIIAFFALLYVYEEYKVDRRTLLTYQVFLDYEIQLYTRLNQCKLSKEVDCLDKELARFQKEIDSLISDVEKKDIHSRTKSSISEYKQLTKRKS